MFALAKVPEPGNLLGADFLVKHELILDLIKKLIGETVTKLGKEPLGGSRIHAAAMVSTPASCDLNVVYNDLVFEDILQPVVQQTVVAFTTHRHDCGCMDTQLFITEDPPSQKL